MGLLQDAGVHLCETLDADSHSICATAINVCESLEMLRLGSAIRLTRKEVERLERITGLPVMGVRTLDDLTEYVADCKAYYAEDSREFEILAWLIDSEVSRCLAAA